VSVIRSSLDADPKPLPSWYSAPRRPGRVAELEVAHHHVGRVQPLDEHLVGELGGGVRESSTVNGSTQNASTPSAATRSARRLRPVIGRGGCAHAPRRGGVEVTTTAGSRARGAAHRRPINCWCRGAPRRTPDGDDAARRDGFQPTPALHTASLRSHAARCGRTVARSGQAGPAHDGRASPPLADSAITAPSGRRRRRCGQATGGADGRGTGRGQLGVDVAAGEGDATASSSDSERAGRPPAAPACARAPGEGAEPGARRAREVTAHTSARPGAGEART
jgi:hypothetical protein